MNEAFEYFPLRRHKKFDKLLSFPGNKTYFRNLNVLMDKINGDFYFEN